jgi:DNA-binding PadR family transcriptional regulator
MMNNNPYESEIPLTEVTYFILLSLSQGPKHGYAIMKDVRELSEDRVILSTGTLYGAIKRLLRLGWISRVKNLSSGDNEIRARKEYTLTQLGWGTLRAEISRLGRLVLAANHHLLDERR